LEQPTVMIVADDPECARSIVARWQLERLLPAFTVMSSDVGRSARTGKWDLAVVSGAAGPALGRGTLLEELQAEAAPVIYVAPDTKAAQAVRDRLPGVVVLAHHEGWLESLVLVGIEALRRADAMKRALRAEQLAAQLQQWATLGRYMLEVRHGLNNALTSVLGNSELLLLEPGALPAAARDQIDTIRQMSLRMHEIIHRFSSLEAEMKFAEKYPGREAVQHKNPAMTARAGD
jgi:signal transduction histidine kinase